MKKFLWATAILLVEVVLLPVTIVLFICFGVICLTLKMLKGDDSYKELLTMGINMFKEKMAEKIEFVKSK